ncbi:ATP-grasp domain-containing protein [Streptomyces sp. NPDC053048]|uniref:ATP-grasp domain-containing protein n=1 Tax=Streptomyces sp. NPDC053048 TaxID=3365694 RepID=UPI0037CD737B
MAHLVLVETTPTAGFKIAQEAVALGHEVTFVAESLDPYLAAEGGEEALKAATRVLTGITTADAGSLLGTLEQLHREHPVHGMLALSEGHLPAIAEAAHALGLPFETPQTTKRLRDKHEVRHHLERAGVPQPGFRQALTTEEAVAAADELGYPVVVKPADGFGSLHVGVAEGPGQVAELAEAVIGTRAYGRGIAGTGVVLLERYVPGPVVSCEMLTVDGVHHAYGCVDKMLSPPPYPVELGGCFPAELTDEVRDAVVRVCAQALDAVGVRRSHTHTEVVLGPDGPQIIEINGRLIGGYVPTMMNYVLGRNVYHDVIELALGGSPTPPATQGVGCIRALTAPATGVLTGIDADAARRAPGVAEIMLHARPGRRVRPARDNFDRLGFVITTGATAPEARAAAEAAHDLTEVNVAKPEGVVS